ncbi:MAG: hypothetical protein ACK5HU_03265, partial [Flavobacteriales bacterium]
MKKFHFYTKIFLTLTFALLWVSSCDNRDLDEKLQNEFPFNLSAHMLTENVYWKSVSNIQLTVDNDHEINEQLFNVTYRITKEGKTFYQGRQTRNFDIDSKNAHQLDFVPLERGDYTVIFKASNGNETYDAYDTLNFNVVNRAFEASVSSERTKLYQSEEEPLRIWITIDEPDWVEYTYSFESKQDNELLDENGTSLIQNTPYNLIENRTLPLTFDPKGNEGMHTLFFTFYDTQGQKLVRELTLEVKSIDVKLELNLEEAHDKEIFFTQTADLTVKLEPVFDNPNNPNVYQGTVKIEGVQGFINLNHTTYRNGDEIELKKGITPFSFFSESNENTTATLTVEIYDQFGHTDRSTLNVNVKKLGYDLELKTQTGHKSEDIFFNENALLTYLLTPELQTNHQLAPTYKAQFTLTGGEGFITLDGQKYNSGDSIQLRKEHVAFTYTPTKYQGKNTMITFNAQDSYGLKKTATIPINLLQRDFNFNTSITGEELLYMGESKGRIQCNLNVSGDSNGIDYFVTPTSNGNGIFYYNNVQYANGETIQVKPGAFEIQYEPSNYNNGIHTISFEAFDSTQQKKFANIQFKTYQKPSIVEGSVRTWYYNDNKQSGICGSCCRRNHHYLIKFDAKLNEGASIRALKLVFEHKDGTIITHEDLVENLRVVNGFYRFYTERYCSSSAWASNDEKF